jgi:non-specific serine/threonine protein kinase
VFAGGWSLSAAEAVCGDEPPTTPSDVLDLLTSLVDRSLVVFLPSGRGDRVADAGGGEARYHLLETVRQYAAERLRGSEDQEVTRNRHRDYYLEWAEEIKPRLQGAEQGVWFGRLEAEHDNLRTALEWCRWHGDIEKELRLAVALARFWDTHGHLREGRAHLETALARSAKLGLELPYPLRTAALVHAGWMAYVLGDNPAARSHYEQSLALHRQRGDLISAARMLNYLAMVLVEEGNFTAARALFEEALVLYRRLGRSAHSYGVLNNLGSLVLRQGEYEVARGYLEESAALCQAAGETQEHGLVLHELSVADLRQGRYAEARARCAASLRLLHECGAVVNLPMALAQMALVAQVESHWERTARLLGAAEGLREAFGVLLPAYTATERAEAAAAARRALGPDTFAAIFNEALSAMDLEQIVAYALS